MSDLKNTGCGAVIPIGNRKTNDFEKPGYWAVIPAGVRYNEQIPPNAKLLYAEISSLTQEDGYCWASNEYFQKVFGFSERSVQRLIRALAESGFIRIENGDSKKRKIYAGINPLYGQDSNGAKNGTVEPRQNCHRYPDKIVTVDEKHIINKNNKKNTKGERVCAWMSERFDGLWNYYPHDKRGSKQRALKAWEQLKPDSDTVDDIARGLQYLMGTDEWQRGIGIPHVSTFLNNRCWEDALELLEEDDGGGWAPDPEVMHHD